jgi:hypothetical protein
MPIIVILLFFGVTCSLKAQNLAGQTNVYFENFDSLASGWLGQNLGSPSSPSIWRLTDSISYSQPFSYVSNETQTNLYPEGAFDALISPPIFLPTDTEKLQLQFRFIASLGFNGFIDSSDYWYVEISEDNGITWDLFSNEKQVNAGNSWLKYPDYYSNTQDGDITQYAGSTVRFRFVLKDMIDGLVGPGLFIDDFAVVAYSCEPDLYEPNETFSTAFSIAFGDSVFAEICPETDLDFFTFSAQQGDFIRVYQLLSTNPRPKIYIFDQNQNLVFSNFYTDDMRFFAQSSGNFYVQVSVGILQQFSTQYNFALELLSPNPDIMYVNDVPDDQGLQVRVIWKASYYDPPTGNNPTDFYALWRQVEDSSNSPILNVNNLTLTDFSNNEFLNNNIFEFDNMLWDFIAQIPAVPNRPFQDYSYVAPTLYDNQSTTFIISAVPKPGYQIPTLWGSPRSGISVDNKMPEFLNYGIEQIQNGIRLSWSVDRIIHHDLMGFRIYRHSSSGFVPSASNLLVVLSDSYIEYLDNIIGSGENYYYKIESVDDAGNSSWTAELSISITSIGTDPALPTEFAISQNYPNPFNPRTKIKYQITNASNVTLKIYDILGNEVAELVNEFKPAGFYEVDFDSNNLSSGVYLYKIEAGSFVQTKKMILMK